MGNTPSESQGARCYQCHRSLRPMNDWKYLETKYIEGHKTFVFFGGLYYRLDGSSCYQCTDCFWKPKREREKMKQFEEQKRQVELMLQREEKERKKQEEQKQKREEKERKRKEELQQQLKEEEEKKHEEKMKKLESNMNTFLEEQREKRNQKCIQENQKLVQNDIIFAKPEANNANDDVDGVLTEPELIHLPDDLQLTKDTVILLLKQVAMVPDISECKINDVICKQSVLFQSIVKEMLFDNKANFYDIKSINCFNWLQVYFLELYCTFLSDEDLHETTAECLHELLVILAEDAIGVKENVDLTRTLYLIYIDQSLETKSSSFSHIRSKWNPQLSKHEIIQIQFLQHIISKSKTWKALEPINWLRSALSLFIKLCTPSNTNENDSHINLHRYFMNLVSDDAWQPHEVIQMFSILSENHGPESLVLASFLEKVCAYKLTSKTNLENDKTLLDMVSDKENVLNEIVIKLKNLTEKEEERDLTELIEVIKENKWANDDIVVKVQHIVKGAIEQLSKVGYPDEMNVETSKLTNAFDVDREISSLSEIQLSECLVTLCCAVKKNKGYYPRVTQMMSWTILLLSDESKGCMVEIATGEGKSCIIAMTAAMIACHKKSVDIVTSSPVLAIRDSEEWKEFYKMFDLSVGHNIHDEKISAYQSNIVYGTVGGFSADILKDEFQLENIRGSRKFDAVIVDEVDFMLLDQGVQFTYLSHKAAGLRHLEPILCTVWNFVSHHKPAASINGDIFFTGIPRPFYLVLADILDTEMGSMQDLPFKLLHMAEDEGIVREGFTQEVYNSSVEKLKTLLSEVSSEDMVQFIEMANEYVPYTLEPYILRSDGKIESAGNMTTLVSEQLQSVPFLVAEKGYCSILHHDEAALKILVVETVKDKLQIEGETDDEKIDVMKSFHELVMNRLPTWVEHAFMAMKIIENRHYLIKDGEVLPIDFISTGIVEIDKKWGGGLQQFVELKHKLKLSSLTLVTNFMSNISFFKRYSGNAYAVTGTLGSDSDQEFLKDQFNVDLCSIPTHKVRKLYEEEGEILQTEEMWMNRICEKVKKNINERPWGTKGRASLIICEDISTAKKIYEAIKVNVTQNDQDLSLYSRSDTNELDLLPVKMHSGQVLVATNLAGRGTNIPVTEEVNMSGGLYVLVTFLPMNTRVEKQAFGRTGRKGQPGSAEIILNTQKLSNDAQSYKSLISLKENRDKSEKERMQNMEKTEVPECLLKESLFHDYCSKMHETVASIHDKDERKIATDSMNEYWGIWLQMKSDEIAKQEEKSLFLALNDMIKKASNDVVQKESPSANVYDIIKFGNESMFEGEYNLACKFYTRAIGLTEKWTTVAFYNRAYCTLIQAEDNYLEKTKEDLCEALKSLVNYKIEVILTKTVVDNSWAVTKYNGGFTKNVEIRVQLLDFFENKINEAIKKLEDIQDKGRDAEAEVTSVFSLATDPDEFMHRELYELYGIGLVFVFSVKEKPRFCWEGLLTLLLGAFQIIAGILITALSMGALSNIGMGMITEGVSDVISGIEALVTGIFSWENWAICKAISIGLSIVTAGIGKLISGGFKAVKLSVKQTFKQLKSLPNIFKSGIRDIGMKQAITESAKQAGKYTAKVLTEKGVMKIISVAEKKILDAIIKEIEDEFTEITKDDMIQKVKFGKMSSRIDCIVAYIYGDNEYGLQYCHEKARKLFQKLGNEVVEPFLDDLKWKGKLSQILQKITDTVRKNSEKYDKIFTAIEFVHIGIAFGDGVANIIMIVNEFDERLTHMANEFIKKENIPELDSRRSEILEKVNVEKIKTDIGSFYAGLIVKSASQIFRSRITGLVEAKVSGKVNNVITDQMDKHWLHKSDTQDKLRQNMQAIYGVNNEGDTLMERKSVPIDYYIKYLEEGTPGSRVDLKILSTVKGKRILVKGLDDDGTMINTVDVGSDKDDQPIILYRARNDKYPEGHYQPIVNGKILQVDNQNKNCLYHAIVIFQNPKLTVTEVNYEATKLKQLVIEEITINSEVWKSMLTQHQWALNVRKALTTAGN